MYDAIGQTLRGMSGEREHGVEQADGGSFEAVNGGMFHGGLGSLVWAPVVLASYMQMPLMALFVARGLCIVAGSRLAKTCFHIYSSIQMFIAPLIVTFCDVLLLSVVVAMVVCRRGSRGKACWSVAIRRLCDRHRAVTVAKCG